MRRGAAWTIIAVFLLFAGCTSPSSPKQGQTSGLIDAHAHPRPEFSARPEIGPQPVLQPDSRFVKTEWGFVRKDATTPTEPMPVLLTMDGYQGAGEPTHYLRVRDGTYIGLAVGTQDPDFPGYVRVLASLRGTACSGGVLDLLDQVGARDGHEVVEFLANQTWTTGRVGLYGNSYAAITATLIAETRPQGLEALAASETIADPYRDVAYPGGILNDGFAVMWPALARPSSDLQGTGAGVGAADEVCAFNVAHRPPPEVADHFLLALTQTTDTPWFQHRAPITYADGLEVPTLFSMALQDEQQGPRGPFEMFHAVHPTPVDVDGVMMEPKRLIMTNGWHRTSHGALLNEALAWFDHWLKDAPNDAMRQPPVRLLLGGKLTDPDVVSKVDPRASLGLDDMPASNTSWTRFYFDAGGKLSQTPPMSSGAADMYVAVAQSDNWIGRLPVVPSSAGADTRGADGPYQLTFRSEPLSTPMLLAGPATATLFISSTSPDTDLFVTVTDVYPDGSMTPLARGFLRASHRAIDTDRSWHHGGNITRVYHPHTNPQDIEPGSIEEYVVEVLPLGHVFPVGHTIQVRVAAPPVVDGLLAPSAARPPAVNTLYRDAAHPSSLLLPIVPLPTDVSVDIACGDADGYACVRPAN